MKQKLEWQELSDQIQLQQKKQQRKGQKPLAVIARKDSYQYLLFLFIRPPHQLLQFGQHDALNYFEVVFL